MNPQIDELHAQQIFGARAGAFGHTGAIRNVLMVHYAYAQMLDEGALGIVPAEDSQTDFVVVVIDEVAKGKLQSLGLPKARDIHGSRLVFRDDPRPDLKYVFFKYAMDLLRYKTRATTSLVLPKSVGQLWIASGLGQALDTLVYLSHRVGYLSIPEAAEFWGIPTGSFSKDWVPEVTRVTAHIIWLALIQNPILASDDGARAAWSVEQRQHKYADLDAGLALLSLANADAGAAADGMDSNDGANTEPQAKAETKELSVERGSALIIIVSDSDEAYTDDEDGLDQVESSTGNGGD